MELGHFFVSSGLGHESINRFLLEGLTSLEVDVFNLTFGDLFYWDRLNGLEQTQIISSNLVPIASNTPRPQPYAVVEIGGFRIGFLGVTLPQRVKPSSGFRALDPVDAVSRWKEEVSARSDFLILLADLPRRGERISPSGPIARLLERHPDLAVVLLAEKRSAFYEPLRMGSSVILSSAERGRFLSWATFRPSHEGLLEFEALDRVHLGEESPEESGLLAQQRALSLSIR